MHVKRVCACDEIVLSSMTWFKLDSGNVACSQATCRSGACCAWGSLPLQAGVDAIIACT